MPPLGTNVPHYERLFSFSPFLLFSPSPLLLFSPSPLPPFAIKNMEIKSLNCPNCSAPLSINPGDTAIKCAHCGSDLRISSSGEASLFFGNAPGSSPAIPGLDVAEVERLTRAGQKINAIKLVREKTNWGLREAKDFVDAIEARSPTPPVPVRPSTAPVFTYIIH